MKVLRRALARILFGEKPIPLYSAVALHAPQDQVALSLTGLGTEAFDVTRNLAVASLRPFLLATVFERGRLIPDQVHGTRAEVSFRERAGDRKTTGRIRLVAESRIEVEEHEIVIFKTTGRVNDGAGLLRQKLYDFHQWWRRRQRSSAHNFTMIASEMRDFYVFYFCPRPVALVSVAFEGCQNMFPMDLVGATGTPYCLMALRRTSPSNRLMIESGRMALAGVPFGSTQIAYELGAHHAIDHVDWDAPPFKTLPSPVFGLPRMADAVSVREVEVVRRETVGSHYLYVTRTVGFEELSDAPQLFHVHGFYEEYRRRSGRALIELSAR